MHSARFDGSFSGWRQVARQLLAQRKDINQKTELVIFLRPTVIREPSMDGDYSRLRDLQPNAEYFRKPNPSRAAPEQ